MVAMPWSLGHLGIASAIRVIRRMRKIRISRVRLEKIVEKDLDAQIIMIETKHKAFVEKLKNRWKKNCPILIQKVKFVKYSTTFYIIYSKLSFY